MSTRRHLRAVAAAALSVAAVAAAAPAADAGVLVASAPNCDAVTSNQVFLPWADAASYFLAPDGGFEGGASGWTLNGASVAADNESYDVSGPGSSALSIPAGATATSPTVCVGLSRPTVRFFARKTSGGLLSSLNVSVLVEDNFGNVSSVPVGPVLAGSSWQPTAPMVVLASLLPLLPGDETPVAFQFSATGGSYAIDDVYVDPYQGR